MQVASLINCRENPQAVALIFDEQFGSLLADWVQWLPVWLIESAENLRVADKIKQKTDKRAWGFTTFSKRNNETLSACCERIIDSLDQHYNACSQLLPYNILAVVGLTSYRVSLDPFIEVGFTNLIDCEDGFIVAKSAQLRQQMEECGRDLKVQMLLRKGFA